jgi:hypothetical protein
MSEKSILDLAAEHLEACNKANAKQKKGTFGTGNFKKKVKSHGLAVHPDQVKEIAKEDKKRGVSVEYNDRGQPVFSDSSHFRRYCKAYGLRHMGY